MRFNLSLVGVSLLVLNGCAASKPLAPAPAEPQPLAPPLQALADGGWTVLDAEHGSLAPVNEWTLQGAAQPSAGHKSSTPALLEGVNLKSTQGNPVKVRGSDQLTCYAEQQAAFWKAHQRGPTDALERYMAGACGLWGYRPYVAHKQFATTDLNELRRGTATALVSLPLDGRFAVAHQDGPSGGSVVTLVYDYTPYECPSTPVAAGGSDQLEVACQSGVPGGFFGGVVSKGDYAWRECRTEMRTQGNETRVRCRLERDDDMSLVDVVNTVDAQGARGPLFRMAVFGENGVLPKYRAGQSWETVVQTPMSDPANVLIAVNEMRRRAGMPRIISDSQLGLRIHEWWRKPDADEIKREFLRSSGAYNSPNISSGGKGQLVIESFILPESLSAGEAIGQAVENPQVRALILSPRIKTLAFRQYRLKDRDAIETVIAGYLR